MKQYLSFFRIRFLAGLQYRAAAWAGISTQFAWGGMTVLLYRAFYESGANSFPMEFSSLSTYIWMQQAFLAMFMTWFYDNEIFETITTGSISYELARPCDLYAMWYVKNMAIRLSRVVLRCLPILLVAAMLPAPYGLRLPTDPMAALLFPISMALGFGVVISFSMLIYISAFFTVSSNGIRILAASVMEFLTGALIPIPFLPVWLQNIFYALPFASMQNTPYLLFSGYLSPADAAKSMALQLFWLIALTAVGRAMMKQALKHVVIQGG